MMKYRPNLSQKLCQKSSEVRIKPKNNAGPLPDTATRRPKPENTRFWSKTTAEVRMSVFCHKIAVLGLIGQR